LPDVSQRQRKGDLVGGKVDGLDLQRVASIQLRYQFRRCFIVSHAAVSETRKERIADRPLAIDDQAGAEPKLQRAGQRHASFLASLTGSISAAAMTGWPASVRASLPLKQISLAPGSLPLPQNFAHS
jgi:hypothetical protein